MTPQIKISVAPAPLGEVLTPQFEAEQRKLLALYHAAPELLDALKACIKGRNDSEECVTEALMVIAKAEGK